MNKQIYLAVISLVVAAILYILGLNEIYFPGNPDIIIYPAGFFALTGAFLLLYARWNSYRAS